ncbi:anaphase-promoting complex subunit 4 [Nymphaea colorata]|nr:anaphase-promoting complex subunit 4 [Nymphaea colorata]XP_031478626.1 anaphase-promoting complex subunit 4 [Nymphaea colorata]
MAESEMLIDEPPETIPFQLQFDNPVASEIKLAEWNPEKDLLAMVTEESKIVLHRFNWQRLWITSLGKPITAICWRPDGKVLAIGLEDGSVSLHDVESGKVLKQVKLHIAAIVCLKWEVEDQTGESVGDENRNMFRYEDRTSRFFPPAPRIPRISGVGSGDPGSMENNEDSSQELLNFSLQRFNLLCSGDKDGSVCFSIFGIFPIGRINIGDFVVHTGHQHKKYTCNLANASIQKIALSKDLSHLELLCFGELVNRDSLSEEASCLYKGSTQNGLHYLQVNTSIFCERKNELHQVAQQASNILELIEVVRFSLSLMHKQWSEVLTIFHEKFRSLSSLIVDHGLDSSSHEELLSLLCGARTSPAIHQFLVNSLGELGLKRVSKSFDSTGKEMYLIIREHLQPAVEIIGFRVGELRALSRFHARYNTIGLNEKLIDHFEEKAGMLLIQVERLSRILSVTLLQFQNFFSWLSKCIKLMSEQSDQLPQPNSELVVVFLRSLFNHDPLGIHLKYSKQCPHIKVHAATMERVEELMMIGGFADPKFLQRTLVEEFDLLQNSCKEAFLLPLTVISQKLHCEDVMPLYSFPSMSSFDSAAVPTSLAYYKNLCADVSTCSRSRNVDYACFRIPNESPDKTNTVGIVRGLSCSSQSFDKEDALVEAIFLHIQDGYHCVDLALYKDCQLVLLLNETVVSPNSMDRAYMMLVDVKELSFFSVSRLSAGENIWEFCYSKGYVIDLDPKDWRVRCVPHSLVAPLAVSASRGVACLFALRRRALVYILEEDEEDTSDVE